MADGGQFDQFANSLDNVDSKCQNDEAPMAALKAVLFSRVVAKKEIEHAEATNSSFHLFLRNEVNGKPPTAAEMQGWATDRKGIWAIESTRKIL